MPEDYNLHSHCTESLKSCLFYLKEWIYSKKCAHYMILVVKFVGSRIYNYNFDTPAWRQGFYAHVRVELCEYCYATKLDSLLCWNYWGAKTSRGKIQSRQMCCSTHILCNYRPACWQVMCSSYFCKKLPKYGAVGDACALLTYQVCVFLAWREYSTSVHKWRVGFRVTCIISGPTIHFRTYSPFIRYVVCPTTVA